MESLSRAFNPTAGSEIFVRKWIDGYKGTEQQAYFGTHTQVFFSQ